MKYLIYIIALVFLISCKRQECKPGEHFECGKGCVANEVKIEQPVQPEIVEQVEPIPTYTKFSISDKVCVWEKETGVVIAIRWAQNVPKGHKPVLVYTVQFPSIDDRENEDYYETELEMGECN